MGRSNLILKHAYITFYDKIPDHIRDWALSQPVFFTASAPLAGAHINISPKGLPDATFSIFSLNECAYVDATVCLGPCPSSFTMSLSRNSGFWLRDRLPYIREWACYNHVLLVCYESADLEILL